MNDLNDFVEVDHQFVPHGPFKSGERHHSPIHVRSDNRAGLVATDIDASNGVIHVIDSVMLPQASATKDAHVAPATTQHGFYVLPQTGRIVFYRMSAAKRR